jgi:hypothetical protein
MLYHRTKGKNKENIKIGRRFWHRSESDNRCSKVNTLDQEKFLRMIGGG